MAQVRIDGKKVDQEEKEVVTAETKAKIAEDPKVKEYIKGVKEDK